MMLSSRSTTMPTRQEVWWNTNSFSYFEKQASSCQLKRVRLVHAGCLTCGRSDCVAEEFAHNTSWHRCPLPFSSPSQQQTLCAWKSKEMTWAWHIINSPTRCLKPILCLLSFSVVDPDALHSPCWCFRLPRPSGGRTSTFILSLVGVLKSMVNNEEAPSSSSCFCYFFILQY